MGLFIVLILVPIMLQHFTIKTPYQTNFERKNQRALAAFFLLLTLMIMFRHETVGNDTQNYINHFERFSRMTWSEIGNDVETGFAYFNKIISFFSKDPRFFLSVVAILVTAMIYPTYRRLCLDPSLTIVLFCSMATFVMMFSGVKQMLAIALGFVAYEFTRRKMIIPFILAVMLAVTFHTSAFMLVFMYPLYHAKITKKWLYVVIPALLVVFIFNRQIFSSLMFVVERFTEYEGTVTQTGAYSMLFLFIIFAVFSFLIPKDSILDEETIGLRNFLLLSVVIQMFAPLHTLAMRMNYYYIIFIPLLLPKIIQQKSERWKQIAVIARHVMLTFFFVYFFLRASGGSNLTVFPYHFFWEDVL